MPIEPVASDPPPIHWIDMTPSHPPAETFDPGLSMRTLPCSGYY